MINWTANGTGRRKMRRVRILLGLILVLMVCGCAMTPARKEPMRVLVVTSRAKDHLKMIAAAGPMLQKMADENHFVVDITDDDSVINDANLARYRVFVQLQEAPFDMKPSEQAAL